jgi:Sigma-70 region 2
VDASDYTKYRPLMFSIAYRMTGSVADAEDIVQEAFLRLANGTEAESPKAFVATVTTLLDGQVQAIRAVANPEKLRHVGPVSRTWHLRSSGTRAESGTGVDNGSVRKATARRTAAKTPPARATRAAATRANTV